MLKLKRPVVARIATITDWPLILIDLFTEEGVVGRSYLEPYTIKTMRYLIPALQDFGAMLKGRRVAPVELYDLARKEHRIGDLRIIRLSDSPATIRTSAEATWKTSPGSPIFR
ncbi:hypothetical protein [Bradyrhizobium erythrophlei]|uniref:hypothetical protein n=1 Tax=Bradyrhizobium erythrophlei TaxID=1437360 RepID=UPI0009A858E9|nr:hypothetical protein [Bradyrhizobium erythrophlei]